MTETPSVKVSNNARSKEELQGVLDDVSEELGVRAEDGHRILMESTEPPFEIVVHVADIINALGVIGGGVAVCASLYKKLQKRIKDRRVQVLFDAPGPKGKGLRYPLSPDTTKEAVAKIAYDCAREVEDAGRMRFWIGEPMDDL